MKDHVKALRDEMIPEKVKDAPQTKVMPKPGQISRYALLTKSDNVKIARKRRKMFDERLAKVKFNLRQ